MMCADEGSSGSETDSDESDNDVFENNMKPDQHQETDEYGA